MTQISQMYEKEKIEYGNQKVREVARAMLDEGIDIVKVMKITGLTEDELLRLRDTAVTVWQFPKCCGSCGSYKAIRLR